MTLRSVSMLADMILVRRDHLLKLLQEVLQTSTNQVLQSALRTSALFSPTLFALQYVSKRPLPDLRRLLPRLTGYRGTWLVPSHALLLIPNSLGPSRARLFVPHTLTQSLPHRSPSLQATLTSPSRDPEVRVNLRIKPDIIRGRSNGALPLVGGHRTRSNDINPVGDSV